MRTKGTGSIFQLKSGYWCGAIEAGRYPNGGRRRLRVIRKERADVVEAMQLLDRTAATVKGGAVDDDFWKSAGEAIDPHGHHVYCLWGADDYFPLYVGRSGNVLARVGDHMRNQARRAAVRRVSFIRCASQEESALLEATIIRYFKPEWNKRGVA